MQIERQPLKIVEDTDNIVLTLTNTEARTLRTILYCTQNVDEVFEGTPAGAGYTENIILRLSLAFDGLYPNIRRFDTDPRVVVGTIMR